jgi:nitroreductase
MKQDIITALNYRYATKKFDKGAFLLPGEIDVILEALRLTPTSYGLQFMKVVVVEDRELREKLLPAAYNQKQVVEASHLLVLCREKELNESLVDTFILDSANSRGVEPISLDGFKRAIMQNILSLGTSQQKEWLEKQVYIALGNLMNTCAMLNIDSCPMEGFIPEQFTEILDLSKRNLVPVLVVPIGKRAVDDKNAQLKKVRRSKENFIVRI